MWSYLLLAASVGGFLGLMLGCVISAGTFHEMRRTIYRLEDRLRAVTEWHAECQRHDADTIALLSIERDVLRDRLDAA